MSSAIQTSTRVSDIVRRMDEYGSQAEPMKTCLGILAIMSREEPNKLVIARDGMETILNIMTLHVDKCDVQEAGCDLLWSLAFGNSTVKEIIAKYGGASVLVRAVKRHGKSADFLKSACGALSNICQSKLNQEGVASLGGLQPLVGSIHAHQNNAKLLPFIFDALAALIVSNEDNARMVSSLGFIPLVVTSISRHKSAVDIVKSGCHALAILTDVKGQASKIAFAGGVTTILPLLDSHPSYADLHRVSTVVLLRMLQESCHVAREIVSSEGVRILLKSLDKGGALHDTVAAVTHILFTVTSPSQSSSAIEPQLWVVPEPHSPLDSPNMLSGKSKKLAGRSHIQASSTGSTPTRGTPTSMLENGTQPSALMVIVRLLSEYKDRKDVVRAACRLLGNVCEYAGVMVALDKVMVVDKLLECVGKFSETRDIVESTINVMLSAQKRLNPSMSLPSSFAVDGLLNIFRTRIENETVVTMCCDLIVKFINRRVSAQAKSEAKTDSSESASGVSGNGDDVQPHKYSDWQQFDADVVQIAISALDKLILHERGSSNGSPGSNGVGGGDGGDDTSFQSNTGANVFKSQILPRKRPPWSKMAIKNLSCLVTLIETLVESKTLQEDVEIAKNVLEAVQSACVSVPLKTSDVGKRLQKLVTTVRPMTLTKAEKEAMQPKETDDEDASKLTIDISDNLHIDPVQPIDKYPRSAGSPKEVLQSKAGQASPPGTKTRKMAFWKVEGPDGQAHSPNGDLSSSQRLLPNHPCKTGPNVRLRESWPNYLERMNPAVGANLKPIEFVGSAVPDRMSIAYEGASAAGAELQSRCPVPLPYNVDKDGVGAPFEHSLTFDSEFESGNLLRAVQRDDAAYDLFLRADLHTPGHTQWFYFAVSNTHPAALVRLAEQGVQVPPVRVRFNIVNLTKPDSLFNLGMRPVMYSVADAAEKNIGWMRAGTEISYYSNPFQRNNQAGEGVNCYYTLSFTLEFHNPRDTYLIAYSYPYTMNDYRCHMREIVKRRDSSDYIRCSQLCTTLGGQDCDLVVITDFKESKEVIGPITAAETFRESTSSDRRARGSGGKPVPLKPALFFSGRVHPGESPASWMMKGMIDYLTSNNPAAVLLRELFVIYIVPILNPDGVYYGNNRCSLAGVDLNRQWKSPMKNLHPTVFTLKAFMGVHRKLREIGMYIDLHGHSRKCNVFMYGADDKKRPKPQVRTFPRFFANNDVAKKYVSYADCSFHVKKGREGTARVIVSKELNIPLSFTLEATFCGPNYGPMKNCHMNTGHLQEVGASLCDTVLRYVISPEGKANFYTVATPTQTSFGSVQRMSCALDLEAKGEISGVVSGGSGGGGGGGGGGGSSSVGGGGGGNDGSYEMSTQVDYDSGSDEEEGSESDSNRKGSSKESSEVQSVRRSKASGGNGYAQPKAIADRSSSSSLSMPAIEGTSSSGGGNKFVLPMSVTRMRLDNQQRSLFSKTTSGNLSRFAFPDGASHGLSNGHSLGAVKGRGLVTLPSSDDGSAFLGTKQANLHHPSAALSAPNSSERRSAPEGGAMFSKRLVRQNSLPFEHQHSHASGKATR